MLTAHTYETEEGWLLIGLESFDCKCVSIILVLNGCSLGEAVVRGAFVVICTFYSKRYPLHLILSPVHNVAHMLSAYGSMYKRMRHEFSLTAGWMDQDRCFDSFLQKLLVKTKKFTVLCVWNEPKELWEGCENQRRFPTVSSVDGGKWRIGEMEFMNYKICWANGTLRRVFSIGDDNSFIDLMYVFCS